MNKQSDSIAKEDVVKLLTSLKGEDYCYLTTTGRITGNPHRIEIWFGVGDATLYLLSGGKDRSDWVKNLLKNPAVIVQIAKHIFSGTARLVIHEEEELMARTMLAEKYQEWEAENTLSEWARTALVVGIDLDSVNS